MKATVEIEAGVCGFRTVASAGSSDDQNVSFDVQTDCEKIGVLGELLKKRGPFDAFQEIGPSGSAIMQAARSVLTGCCAGCAVPVGMFKAMQVAAGLALPKDMSIRLTKE